MDVLSCDLADYGYDYVVATTQASINSGLVKLLATGDQPTQYICFLLDSDGDPTVMVSLDDLLKLTNNVNPFLIPYGTDYGDARIITLSKCSFYCGIKIRMGKPPNVMPKALGPIVEFGSSATTVTFNMYCSEFEIFQNQYTSDGVPGRWNVYSQATDKSGKPWCVSTKVDLVVADLASELNTPYFDRNPEQKQAIADSLKNYSGTAFSIRQLMFDLDNAALQTTPAFSNIPSNISKLLTQCFVKAYSASAKDSGLPLLAVVAVAQNTDGSQLVLTDCEREVCPLLDDNGDPFSDPTPTQTKATTLNYLCMVRNHELPLSGRTFPWNWVEQAEIDDKSGVMAIDRSTFGNVLIQLLQPYVLNSCIAVTTDVTAHAGGKVEYSGSLTPDQWPQTMEVPYNGSTIVNVAYENSASSHDKSGVTYGQFDIDSKYSCSCDISDDGIHITVKQHLCFYVFVKWDETGSSANVFDKTITDVYSIDVDQNGALILKDPDTTSQDDSQEAEENWFTELFTGIGDVLDSIKSQVEKFAGGQLASIPMDRMRSFVFPGGKVFTYKNAVFSKYQTLLCDITYANSS